MAKKAKKMSTIENLDTFIPIICICWVLVFGYISIFVESTTMALITVMPVFFLYGFFLIGSAIYCYKEIEFLSAMGKDIYEIEKKYRDKKPVLNKAKLIVAGCCILFGILLCIFL